MVLNETLKKVHCVSDRLQVGAQARVKPFGIYPLTCAALCLLVCPDSPRGHEHGSFPCGSKYHLRRCCTCIPCVFPSLLSMLSHICCTPYAVPLLLQARGRTLGPAQIIEVKERFNDLKSYVWGGAVPIPVIQVQHVVTDNALLQGRLLCSLPCELLGQTSKHRATQVRG